MSSYIIVDGSGNWEELDAGQMVVEVTDEWLQSQFEEDVLDADCQEYTPGKTDGIIDHWHVQDIFFAMEAAMHGQKMPSVPFGVLPHDGDKS